MNKDYMRIDFRKTNAYAKLSRLASSPVDLTIDGALSPERIDKMKSSAVGFDLLYATQRVTDEVIDALQQLADETHAVDQFEMMIGGEIMNEIEGYESERRQVLHTACRDIFDERPRSLLSAVTEAKAELQKLKLFLEGLDRNCTCSERNPPFTDMVQIGIGGSDLGPRAIYLALQAYGRKDRKVHFVSNVDPDDAFGVIEKLDLSRTLIVVVSKSGKTLETLTNEQIAVDMFKRAKLDPKLHFIAVTGKGSPMDDPQKYLETFYMYDYIGGRFSSSSMVGGVSLGFGLGYDKFLELLRGANEMDKNALERDVRKNLSLLSALIGIWNRNFLGYETLAILPYSNALSRFVAHLQQLDMESNGKSVNRQGIPVDYATGPIVWGEPGTNGQHAFYQLIHQSNTIVPVEFIGFRQSQYCKDLEVEGTTSQEKLLANLIAQSIALAKGKKSDNSNKAFPGNRPSSILIADRLDPFSMGALLAYYENKVAFQGFIWNINSFDQEGVQLGKTLSEKILDHYRNKKAYEAYNGGDDPVGWAMMRSAKLI